MRVGVRDFSLYKRPRKGGRPVYYARLHNDDGSWTTGCSTGQTVRSLAEGWAAAEVRRRQADVQEGEQAPPADTAFAAFAGKDFFGYEGRWALDKRASGKRLSPRQCLEKRRTFDKHVIPILGQMKLHEINCAVLKDFRNAMYQDGYSAPRSTARWIAFGQYLKPLRMRTVSMPYRALTAQRAGLPSAASLLQTSSTGSLLRVGRIPALTTLPCWPRSPAAGLVRSSRCAFRILTQRSSWSPWKGRMTAPSVSSARRQRTASPAWSRSPRWSTAGWRCWPRRIRTLVWTLWSSGRKRPRTSRATTSWSRVGFTEP